MRPAQRQSEFVADLAPQYARLRESQVKSVRGSPEAALSSMTMRLVRRFPAKLDSLNFSAAPAPRPRPVPRGKLFRLLPDRLAQVSKAHLARRDRKHDEEHC